MSALSESLDLHENLSTVFEGSRNQFPFSPCRFFYPVALLFSSHRDKSLHEYKEYMLIIEIDFDLDYLDCLLICMFSMSK